MQGTTGCYNFLRLARVTQQSALHSHPPCTKNSKCILNATASTTQPIVENALLSMQVLSTVWLHNALMKGKRIIADYEVGSSVPVYHFVLWKRQLIQK